MKRYLSILLFLCLMLNSCKLVEKMAVASKHFIQNSDQTFENTTVSTQDIELAKMILKPAPANIDISRDPFQPLVEQDWSQTEEAQANLRKQLANIQLIGVIKIDNNYLALIDSDSKRKLYKVNDVFMNYTIEKIQMDHIILSDGDSKITLKRGISN